MQNVNKKDNVDTLNAPFIISIIFTMNNHIMIFQHSNIQLRGAFKIKKRRNLGKVPNRGRRGHQKFKKFPSFSWEKFKKRGGVITFQKSPK